MTDFAERMRAAARRLSLTDSEVARRLEISQQRLTHYANGTRKPDFAMLGRICRILATTPNELLGFGEVKEDSPSEVFRERIAAAAAAMNEATLKRAAAVMDTLAADGSEHD